MIAEACGVDACADHTHGWLAFQWTGKVLPVTVLGDEGKGYYIGTSADNRAVSRESEEIYTTQGDALAALDNKTWTQKLRVV